MNYFTKMWHLGLNTLTLAALWIATVILLGIMVRVSYEIFLIGFHFLEWVPKWK